MFRLTRKLDLKVTSSDVQPGGHSHVIVTTRPVTCEYLPGRNSHVIVTVRPMTCECPPGFQRRS